MSAAGRLSPLSIALVLAGACTPGLVDPTADAGADGDGEAGPAVDPTDPRTHAGAVDGSFAAVARTGTVRLADGSEAELTYLPIDAWAVRHGDVIVGVPVADATGDTGRSGAPLARLRSRLWPGAVVPYVIDPDVADPERVYRAIEAYEAETPLRFVERHEAQADYVRFVAGSACLTWQGRRGGAQEIVLDGRCHAGRVAHLIGHAIGLAHEHQRPDRDEHIEVLEDGRDPSRGPVDVDFERLDEAAMDGPYDMDSIMHFGPSFGSSDGSATLRSREAAAIPLRQRDAATAGFSSLDREHIFRAYARSGAAGCASVGRVAGGNRFGTAVAVAEAYAPAPSVVFIVNGENAVATDAIAASPYANALGAPILLARRDALPTETRAALEAMAAASSRPILARIVGGTGVVSEAVAAEVRAALGTAPEMVTRLAGPTRVETALAVADAFGPATTAMIVSAGDAHFAEALVAAAAAGRMNAVVLLTPPDALPDSVASFLATRGIERTYVIGDLRAVSDAVMAALPSPTRIYGPDRYETSLAVARFLAADGALDEVLFIDGLGLADGFAASAVGRPVILVGPGGLSLRRDAPSRPDVGINVPAEVLATTRAIDLIGGTAVLPERVEQDACVFLHEELDESGVGEGEPLPPVHSEVGEFATIGGVPGRMRDPFEYGPTIVLHEGVYHAWYCQADGVEDRDQPGGWDRIGYATSSDGRTWAAHPPALRASYPYFHSSVCDPSVIRQRDQWIMYVTCIDVAAPDGYFNNRICAATAPSPGGPWTIVPEPVLEDTDCWPGAPSPENPDYCMGQPTALVHNEQVYLYVTHRVNRPYELPGQPGQVRGADPAPSPGQLQLAISDDGLRFGARQFVFDHADADVKYDRASRSFVMVFGEVDDAHVYWSQSPDGVRWLPYDATRRIAVPDVALNHNPGLSGDAEGTFSGRTFALYGASYDEVGVHAQWNLHRSELFFFAPGGPADCRACAEDSCERQCQQLDPARNAGGECRAGAGGCCVCDPR